MSQRLLDRLFFSKKKATTKKHVGNYSREMRSKRGADNVDGILDEEGGNARSLKESDDKEISTGNSLLFSPLPSMSSSFSLTFIECRVEETTRTRGTGSQEERAIEHLCLAQEILFLSILVS